MKPSTMTALTRRLRVFFCHCFTAAALAAALPGIALAADENHTDNNPLARNIATAKAAGKEFRPYALLREPASDEGRVTLFHSCDRVLVEHLTFQLGRDLGIPVGE